MKAVTGIFGMGWVGKHLIIGEDLCDQATWVGRVVKFVMVSLDKEMYSKIVEKVKNDKLYFISNFVKNLVIEFFESPHELDIKEINERRIRSGYAKLQLRLPKDVYENLKEYANRHGVGIAHVVRAIIAERLGIQLQHDRKEKKVEIREERLESGMVTVTFKLEQDVLKKLDLLAINTKRTRSTLIREAIMHLVNGGYNTTNQTGHNLAATREL